MDYSIRQSDIHDFSATERCLAGVAWIDFYLNAPSFFRFVRSELYRLTPRRVGYRLRKTVIPEHPSNVQLLKNYDSKLVHKIPAQLMGKVFTAIADSFVPPRNHFVDFLAFRRSLWNRTQFLLGFRQCLFIAAKETGIVDLLSGRKRGKGLQSHVDADRFIGGRKWLRVGFHGKASEPFASSTPADSQRSDFAFNRSVQFEFNAPNLGQSQLAALDAESRLRIGQTVVSETRTEARETWFLSALQSTKESIECFIQSLQGLLQNLRVNEPDLWPFDFNSRKLDSLSVIVDRLAAGLPSIPTFLKGRVIQFAAQGELRFKNALLCPAWKYSESEGFLQLFLSLVFDVLLNYFQRSAAHCNGKVRWTPQVTVPQPITKGRKRLEHSPGRHSLETVNDLGNLMLRRSLENNVDVIHFGFYGYQIKIHLLAQVRKNLLALVAYLFGHHGPPILNAPHNMILKLVDRMTAGLKIVFHPFSIAVTNRGTKRNTPVSSKYVDPTTNSRLTATRKFIRLPEGSGLLFAGHG